MLLNESGIEELISEMKDKSLNIESLQFKYSPKKNHPYALVYGEGVSGIAQDEDYYINFEENIFAAEFSWFEPLCKFFRSSAIDASVTVLPDGNFEQEKVKIEAKLELPKGVENVPGFLYPRFKPFVLFYPYLKNIEVKGFEGVIRNVIFSLEIDARTVTSILKEPNKYNRQMLEQWLVITDKCERDNIGRNRFENSFKVINGKINYEARTELVSKFFNIRRGEIG
ncbi:hypothetical protein NC797_07685 [Aquibacillus sp. 3ASR75-11]|uniref:Uncharacterized protein n=1 Tax=Terrihalobacillus insolitus TaxID=2950438 RepID=A0A9X4ALH2_9BACI|nr:hypothetical protein [Terrihalobacillus insolitus]MDC3424387.1 hypothetical protein [Terrihalobacillus insolitus]